MYQAALQSPMPLKHIPKQHQAPAVTHVALNYHEWLCIELALLGAAACLGDNALPAKLANEPLHRFAAQLRYLRLWFDKPTLQAQLHRDGTNTVWWPCTSAELVDWLIPICQSCISEDAILIAAADATRDDYAVFSETYLDDTQQYSCADNVYYCQVSALQHYYNDVVMATQATLVDKLMQIQAQGYPLWPQHVAIH